MTLHEEIKNQIKAAMLAKDTVRLETMRGVSAAVTNFLVANGKTPQDIASDTETLAVITKLSKQRKDSISQYQAAGRDELVSEEQAQLAILEQYLPKLMSKEEISTIAAAKKSELDITDPTKKGLLMSSVMKELAGKADGSVVKEVIDSLFQ